MNNNLIIFGFPRSGKTTLGKMIANKLKKEFINTIFKYKYKYSFNL